MSSSDEDELPPSRMMELLGRFAINRGKGEVGFSEAGKRNPFESPACIALVTAQCLEGIFLLSLLGVADPRKGNEEDVRVKFGSDYVKSFMNMQVVVNLFALGMCLYGLFFTLGTFVGDNLTRLFDLVLVKAITITIIDTFLLAYFVVTRVTLVGLAALAQLAVIVIVFKLNWQISSALVDADSLRDVPTITRSLLKMRTTSTDQTSQFLSMYLLEKLLLWLSGPDAARTFSGRGRENMTRVAFFAIFLVFVGFAVDYSTIVSKDLPLFSSEDFEWVRENHNTNVTGWSHAADGTLQRLTPTSGIGSNKVVLLLFDGMGFNHFDLNLRMTALRNNATFAEDLQLLKLQADVPTADITTWQQMISGVRADTTGIRGDHAIGNPGVDTIFHQIKNTNSRVAVSSVPWFTGLFHDAITPLTGLGSLSSDFRDNPSLEPIVPDQDWGRLDAVVSAIHSPTNYALIVGHFFNVDYMGHKFGTESPEYTDALGNAADMIQAVWNNVTDDSTVVLVVGNHGHLYGGGHGGGTEAVMEIPVLVYRKEASLSTQVIPRYFVRDNSSPDLIDLCPSLAALVGVPVPRHNQGIMIDELITPSLVHPETLPPAINDLFSQQQTLVTRWLQKMGFIPSQFSFDTSFLTWEEPGPVDGILDLRSLLLESTWQQQRNLTRRNIAATLMIVLTVTIVWVYVWQTLTISDPFAIVWFRVHPGLRAWMATPDIRSAKLALLCVATYFAVVWGIFAFAVSAARQAQFDSSFLHSFYSQITYCVLVFFPGIISVWLISRFIAHELSGDKHFGPTPAPVVDEYSDEEDANTTRWPLLTAIHDFLFGEVVILEIAYKSIFHMYLLFFALTTTMWIVFGASTQYSFLLPTTFRLPFLSAPGWTTQFQLMTAIGICLPLLVYATVHVYTWANQPVDTYLLYEMNRFRTEKAQRYRDVLSVDLGEPAKQSWQLPDVSRDEETGGVSTKAFDRLSDWCVEVMSTYTLPSAEKRRIIGEQYDIHSNKARHSEQERAIVLKQLDDVSKRHNAHLKKASELEDQIDDNKDLLARGVDALRERVQKEMDAEAKTLMLAHGKKPAWKEDRPREENRRMGKFVLERLVVHEQQKLRNIVEGKKMWVASQLRDQFDMDVEHVRKQQRDVVEQTMVLITKQDALDSDIAQLNLSLDEIVARIKEFEVVKKRIAEGINNDILVHKQIQREIMEELKKEADYHMYVHNLIDSVSDEISEKRSKINMASTQSKDIEHQLETEIEELTDKIESSRRQKMELFKEVKNTVDQLRKTKSELKSNLRWAEEYKQRLAVINREI